MKFLKIDIVVWNGIITEYGVIKDLIGEGDSVEFAENEDFYKYFNVQ